jgi:hypothetical protein
MYEIIFAKGSAVPEMLRGEGVHDTREVEKHCFKIYLPTSGKKNIKLKLSVSNKALHRQDVWGSSGIAPIIPELCARWEVVNFTLREKNSIAIG